MIWIIPRDPQVQTWNIWSEAFVRDAQGGFEVHGVKPGAYYLVATSMEDGKQYTVREPISVTDSDVEGITLVIGRGADISGRVVVEGKSELNLNTLNLWLEPHEQGFYFGRNGALLKPDGTFLIENLADDTYDLQVVDLPEEFYLKAVRSAGEDVLDLGLEVSRKQRPGPLEVVLSAGGGFIEGSVLKDSKPFTGAMVVLVPAPDQRKQKRLYKSISTDQNGQFLLRGIAPGDYKLFAWESIQEGAYQDPEFLRPYEDRGKPVHIDEGTRLNQQLELIPANEVDGE